MVLDIILLGRGDRYTGEPGLENVTNYLLDNAAPNRLSPYTNMARDSSKNFFDGSLKL